MFKEEITQYCKNCFELAQQLDQLKAENEELKKEIAFGNNGTLSDKIRAIVFKDLNKENNKLKQTLAEISNIVQVCCKTTDCKKCKFFEICENNCVDVILQKIREVEDANN